MSRFSVNFDFYPVATRHVRSSFYADFSNFHSRLKVNSKSPVNLVQNTCFNNLASAFANFFRSLKAQNNFSKKIRLVA